MGYESDVRQCIWSLSKQIRLDYKLCITGDVLMARFIYVITHLYQYMCGANEEDRILPGFIKG